MAISIELRAFGVALASGIFVVGAAFGVAGLVTAHSTPPPAPAPVASAPNSADLAGEIVAGRNYFASSCSGCHGENGDGGNDAPSLHNEDLSDADITSTIKNGSGRMPSFAKIYNAYHTREIVEFIRTLK